MPAPWVVSIQPRDRTQVKAVRPHPCIIKVSIVPSGAPGNWIDSLPGRFAALHDALSEGVAAH